MGSLLQKTPMESKFTEQISHSRSWLWASVLAVLLLLNGVLASLAWQERQNIFVGAEMRSKDAAMMVLQRVEAQLQKLNYLLSGISEVIGARGGLQEQPDIYLHRLLVRRNALADSVSWLFIVSSDGILRESSSRFPAIPIDVNDREYFRQQLEHWDQGLFIGAPLKSRVSGESFIPVSRRVTNDGDLFLGVAAAGYNPATLEGLLAAQGLPSGYMAGAFLLGGAPLACLGFECGTQSLLALPNTQGSMGKSVEGAPLIGDEEVVGHYEMSGSFPLVVAVQVPESQLVQNWQQWLKEKLPLALGLNFVFLFMSWIAFTQFLRRNEALDALKSANEELDARVQIRTLQLQASEAQARAFMMATTDAVIVIDAKSVILEFNHGAEQMFSYTAAEVVGGPLDQLMPPEMVLQHRQLIQHKGKQVGGAMGKGLEVLALRKGGARFPVEVTIGAIPQPDGMIYVGVMRDITERKEVEWRLTQMATIDALTGVFNRRAFMEQGEAMFTLARRYEWPLSVMMLDADHFKRVNDTYGHHVGDLVLQALATQVREALRSTDILGRLGGEEFGLILPETGLEGAQELGGRILDVVRAIRVPVEGGESISFTVSIGVAVLQDGINGLDELFHLADSALYAAKNNGRNQMQVAPSTSM